MQTFHWRPIVIAATIITSVAVPVGSQEKQPLIWRGCGVSKLTKRYTRFGDVNRIVNHDVLLKLAEKANKK